MADGGAPGSSVAVLFARPDSIYKTFPGCDVYDIARDARTWPGGSPAVAHPPCRAWGRLRQFAKPRADEKALALFAVDTIRRFGGVLEHPASSSLWPAAGLPAPASNRIPRDEFGGWTLAIAQSWFGHKAEKLTWLYIVGVEPGEVPPFPLSIARPTHCIAQNRRRDGKWFGPEHPRWLPKVSKAEREHTPPAFAAWLVQLADLARTNKAAAHG